MDLFQLQEVQNMSQFTSRLSSFISLIRMKEKAYKVKEQKLKGILRNKKQIREAKKASFQFQSIR